MKTRKDFEWSMNGITYVVQNVPYQLLDAEGEEFVSLSVAVKLEMIRELMYSKNIPHNVDFNEVEDIEFGS